MALLKLSDVYKRYPNILKYGFYDVRSTVDNKIRRKKILTDEDRRILRLDNAIQDKDDEIREDMQIFAERYEGVDELTEKELALTKNKEMGMWALYSELIENLESNKYLNDVQKLTKGDVDFYINTIANEKAKPTERKRKPQLKRAKSTFRSGDSQGKDMIRNMNRMTGTTLKRFQK